MNSAILPLPAIKIFRLEFFCYYRLPARALTTYTTRTTTAPHRTACDRMEIMKPNGTKPELRRGPFASGGAGGGCILMITPALAIEHLTHVYFGGRGGRWGL